MKILKLYSASWCQPCRIMKQQLEQANIPFEYIDIGNHQEELKELEAKGIKIMTVPTMIIFENNMPIWVKSGLTPICEILDNLT